jgi:hypothetical protein
MTREERIGMELVLEREVLPMGDLVEASGMAALHKKLMDMLKAAGKATVQFVWALILSCSMLFHPACIGHHLAPSYRDHGHLVNLTHSIAGA